MKRFWKTLFYLFSIILISLLLTCLFYKEFCSLNQTTNWTAVSSIVDIVLLLITIISVCVAIYIPQRDRIESSKIQLYEQRFELYYLLRRMMYDGNLSQEVLHGQTVNEKFDKTLKQASFLVNKDDRKRLEKLKNYTVTKSKVDEKHGQINFKIVIPIDEQQELDEIFEKYLDIGGYGINKKSFLS